MKTSLKFCKTFLSACVLSGFFISCDTDTTEFNGVGAAEIITDQDMVQEMAYPNKRGEIETVQFYGESIQAEKINDQYIIDGDIIIVPDDLSKSTGRSLESFRWPNNIVYYEIQNRLPDQQRIRGAIAEWEAKTPLRFQRRTNQNDYVFFQQGDGCSSFVGRIGGRQEITLASGCPLGTVIHEIGHAVGLWHEQSRKDRDTYVTVNLQNISSNAVFNFQTYNAQGEDGDEFTNALDFNSIMLYDSYAFSINGEPTIVRKDGSTYPSNRRALSRGDIDGINIMYSGSGPVGGICDGIQEWLPNVVYSTGDRVTYFGNLFQLSTSGWVLVGSCDPANSRAKSKSKESFEDLNKRDPQSKK